MSTERCAERSLFMIGYFPEKILSISHEVCEIRLDGIEQFQIQNTCSVGTMPQARLHKEEKEENEIQSWY